MPRSPRAEALRLLRDGQHIERPSMPANITPTSPEAAEHLNDTKVARYVVLARLIDQLFDQALGSRQPDKRELPMKKYHRGDRWYALADNWHSELQDSWESLRETELYRTANAFADVKGTLQPGTHISIDSQISAGTTTGVSATLSLLRNLPHITRDLAKPTETVNPAQIARHPRSLELTRRLAKMSINQMVAAQAVLAEQKQRVGWTEINKTLDPKHFTLRDYPDGQHSLSYADLAGLQVPAGYMVRDFPSVPRPTPVSELPSFQAAVVGCPVTLLEKRLGQLWHWGIDLVEANELWNENWPPATAPITHPALSRLS